MEDGELLELYHERSERAIAETRAKYGAYCLTVAGRILRDRRDAEECVSDAFLRAWNAIPPASPVDLRAYLRKITRNLAVSRLQSLTAEKRGGGEVELALEELSECIPSVDGPERAAEELAVREALNGFLEKLPELTRRMFVLRYWYVLPVGEIAKKLRVKESRVTVTLYRARERLRKELEEEGITL